MDEAPYVDDFFEEYEFDPCDHRVGVGTCGSVRFYARFFQNGQRKISVYCDQDHLTTRISGGQWVPNDFFRLDDRYSGMLPVGWIPIAVPAGRREVTLELKANIAFKTREIGFCVVCGVKPFYRTSDRVVYESLKDFRWGTFQMVEAHLASHGEASPDRWIGTLPPELADRVANERAGSLIQADHVVPVRVLSLMRASLSGAEIELARTLAIPLCARCNRGRGSALYDNERLLEYYAAAHYDGDRQRMMRSLRERYFDLMSLNEKAARSFRSA